MSASAVERGHRERKALESIGIQALTSILKHVGGAVPAVRSLADVLAKTAEKVGNALTARPALLHQIKEFHDETLIHAKKVDDLRCSLVLLNVAGLLGLLLDAFEGKEWSGELSVACESALENVTLEFVAVSQGQLSAIAEALVQMLHGVEHMIPNGGEVAVVDLPVGNTLIAKLATEILSHRGYGVRTLRVSLSRNDSSKKGLTRKELLDQKLDELGPCGARVIVYIDEWYSGTNFDRVAELLRKSTTAKRSGRVLSLPLRAHGFEQRQNLDQRQTSRLTSCGLSAEDYPPVLVPAEQTIFPRRQYFFWTDRDRAAGCRKMQFLGSVLSGLEAAADAIHTNLHGELARALELLFRAAPTKEAMPGTPEQVESWFADLYSEGYEDFTSIREELRRLPEAAGELEQGEVEEEYSNVLRRLEERVKGRAAERCVELAALLAQDAFPSDPVDRYFLDAAAPTVSQLEGTLARHHEVLMTHIKNWLLKNYPALRASAASASDRR